LQKVELQEKSGVYVLKSELMAALELAKPTPTGLMRTLIGIFYTTERLACSSATKGINTQIKTAIFGN